MALHLQVLLYYQERGRRRKLLEIIVEPDLSEQDKTPLCNFLIDHHDVFALEDTDRGETDLIQLVEI